MVWLQEGVDYDGIGAQDDVSFPSELSEGTNEVSSAMMTSVDSSSELFEENLQSPTGETGVVVRDELQVHPTV